MTPTKNRKVSKHKSRNKLWLAIGTIAIVIIVVGLYSVISQPGNEYSASSTKVLLRTSMGI